VGEGVPLSLPHPSLMAHAICSLPSQTLFTLCSFPASSYAYMILYSYLLPSLIIDLVLACALLNLLNLIFFFVIYILLILHLGSICGSAILTLCDRSIPTSLVMPAFWIKTEGLRNIHELRLRVNRGFTLLHSLLCHVTWLYIVHFIIFR